MLRIVSIFIFAVLLCLPAEAEVVKIAGNHGMAEIAGACASAGGEFIIHDDAGGYGCTKKNCDGKGGDCHVACDNGGNCNGSTPARLAIAVTMLGLLQNGNNVYYNQSMPGGSGDSLSTQSAGAPAMSSDPTPKFD